MKTIKIAHRGNFEGRNSNSENEPSYIDEAIFAGYDVEVDVWLIHGMYYLGHDKPEHEILYDYLRQRSYSLWIHCKNLESYLTLYRNNIFNVFWHDKDDFTFTSAGFKWANAGVSTNDGIMVMPEYVPGTIDKIISGEIKPLGVCSDDFRVFNKF